MKDLFTPLLEPMGLVWAVLLLLAGWHALNRRWRHTILPLTLCAMMAAIGSTRLSARLLASLERPYAGVNLGNLAQADAVVMLGGVLRRSRFDPIGFDLADAADRVLTSAHIARLGKGKTLVLGGGGPRPGETGGVEGELLRDWLDRWNVVRIPITLLGACKNTRDEAERVRVLMDKRGWKRVILVTSAAHMRRSEAVFRKLDIPATCVACDFRGMAELEAMRPFTPFPRLGGFELLQNYLHEQIGWWIYRLRGWV